MRRQNKYNLNYNSKTENAFSVIRTIKNFMNKTFKLNK